MTSFAIKGARRWWALGLTLGAGSALLIGCGGGGSGGGSGSGVSFPTPTPTTVVPTGSSLVVQLRDPLGNPVDGVVTLGTRRSATTSGTVSFDGVALGANSVSAEVNGRTYSQSFVASAGTNTVQILINPALSPTPVGTLPAPPSL